MIGWQQWSYWNRDPCCERQNEGLVFDPALPPTGENVKYGKLRLSARPHPDAVAGTPLSYWFRPGKRIFGLEFSTRRPEGRTRFASGSTTVVTVPRRHYRDGYRVSVRGARVVSKSGARVLRIRSCRRSGTVRLRVTPGRTPRSALECGSRD